MNRRAFVSSILGGALFSTYSVRTISPPNLGNASRLLVYRSEICECCRAWIAGLRTKGFIIVEAVPADGDAIRRQLKVPKEMFACHTAVTDGYVFEGHIPADLITKVLEERPNLLGLALPGMPEGAPGMESAKRKIKERHKVYAFSRNGVVRDFAEILI